MVVMRHKPKRRTHRWGRWSSTRLVLEVRQVQKRNLLKLLNLRSRSKKLSAMRGLKLWSPAIWRSKKLN